MSKLARQLCLLATFCLLLISGCSHQVNDSALAGDQDGKTYSSGLEIEESTITINQQGKVTVTLATNPASTTRSALTILGLARTSNRGFLQVRRQGGATTWQSVSWPAPSQEVVINDFCERGGTNVIEVRATNNLQRLATLPSIYLAVLSQTETSISVGHETLFCLGAQCQKDDIATLACKDAKIALKN